MQLRTTTSTLGMRILTVTSLALFLGCSGSDSAAPIDHDATGDVGLDDVSGVDTGDTAALDTSDDDTDGDVDPDAVETDTGGGEDVTPTYTCGNGILEEGEACDDGNNFPGDGCSALCDSNEQCGNGFVDSWEECDDGNLFPGDGCNGACGIEAGCGNGHIDRGEQCDDGNTEPADGCSPTCQRETVSTLDSDEDGISDFDEGDGAADTDGDGTPDNLDTDSDNDGILDMFESGDDEVTTPPVDTDGDGIADFRDQDADGDGIPDAFEGSADTDGDGLSDFQDVDSDGDYVPDALETVADSDGDGIPDYLDLDSDGDTILDAHELFADSDDDGVPNRVDLDSDGDLLPDSVEAGDADPNTYPEDMDGDGQPNYIDIDSDGDGLHDDFEPGCPAGPWNNNPDSDGDGYDDLAELLVGSDPCVATSETEFHEYTDFFFVLPEGDPPQEAPLEFSSNIRQADVHFNMDTTGSMGGEIAALQNSLTGTIIPQTRAQIPNTAFGFSQFDDFPCSGFGSGSDRPFILRQRVTTDDAAARNAVNALQRHSGNDGPESGYEALYQIGAGTGISGSCTTLAAFNPSAGLVPGVADGTIGGVGFRTGSFPIAVHITDAVSHESSDYPGSYGAHSSSQAISALQGNNVRVIGVASGSSPRGQLENVARQTGAVVRACAWDGARPGGCGAGQCCTGSGGAGRSASGGECPLVFDIGADGSGLSTAVVTGIAALVNTTTLEVTTELRRDDAEFAATGIDTTCFIQNIIPSHSVGSGTCSTTATPADINPTDGVMDSFQNVTPGTQLFFDVVAENNVCVPATDVPQAFNAYIDVIGDGLTVLDTQLVTIIVPAAEVNPTTVP